MDFITDRNKNPIILGGISGCFFTMVSHPFHVLTTRYNREVIKGIIEPSLQNSIAYTVEFLKKQPMKLLRRGITIRTLQGTLTYSFLFFVRDYFNRIFSIENQKMKNITVSASSGYSENIIRQPFLILSSAYINKDNLLSRNLWINMVKGYPLTSLNRSLYFTSSTIGKSVGSDLCNSAKLNHTSSQIISGLFGTAFCIRFNGFSESYTNALTSGQNINQCFKAGIKGSRNVLRDLNLVSRETIFLIPFLFPISNQYKKD